MSTSPELRPFQEEPPSVRNKHQIRLVPYSPPRLSLDDGPRPTSSTSSSDDGCTVIRPSHTPSDIPKGKGKSSFRLPSDDGHLGQGIPSASHASTPAVFSNSDIGQSSHHPSDAIPNEHTPLPSPPLADDSSLLQDEAATGGSSLGTLSTWNDRLKGGLRMMARHTSSSTHPTATRVSKRRALIPARFSRLRPNVAQEVPSKRVSLRQKHFRRNSRSGFGHSGKSIRSTYAFTPPSSVAVAVGSTDGPLGGDFIEGSPFSSCSNVEILGNPSPEQSRSSCSNVEILGNPSPGQSRDGDQGESSYLASRDVSIPWPSFGLRHEFSRESLLVPPLRTPGEGTEARFPLSTSRSQESFRAGSLSSSVSAIIEEATCSVLVGGTAVRIPIRSSGTNTSRPLFSRGSGRSQSSLVRQHHCSPALAIAGNGSTNSPSCSQALCSGPSSAIGRRRSQSGRAAGVYSGSTVLGDDSIGPASEPGEFPLEPKAVYRKGSIREPNNSTIRLIWNQDEHGDGLGDLEKHHRHHPSRSIMYSLFTNVSSDRNLQSSSSSRSNSISRSSIPAWAKLYYGSGERRFLASALSSESLLSEYNFHGRSRASSFLSRSPSAERYPAVIQSPRRRPLQAMPSQRRCDTAERGDDADEILESPTNTFWPGRRLREQTSSIWSPHLRRDRRAYGYKIWDAPSTVWSANEPLLSRRRLQPTLFGVGFVFPLAWVIAAFLPLPPMPRPKMMQDHGSTQQFDAQLEANLTLDLSDIRLYSHARWWRTLNRAMSVVGTFVIGAIIALIVTGVRQRWKS
ncbi:hypothetical protein L249_5358 [Ophiocordyceps polyrhachis-furcata BCC 54312]|uniref:Serine-rich protein n=1 Tax=Ophiocordyceps polyrhachis-furcata BCC 54312 TaxID=1330021 RepID=A0A367L9R6_9HYPO|nr:hypothetical protein L249_5358 [Ophiocordyceps polyrhachis-furcata BCC 54312]